MKRCKYEGWVDGYILNRLSESEQKEFEEHYFNCSFCFQTLAEKDDIIGVLKRNRSVFIAEERPAIETQKAIRRDKRSVFFGPRQWVFAGAATVLIMAALVVAVLLHNASPEFILNGEDTVRGKTLTLLSPVIDVHSFPSYFEWKAIGTDTEYRVYVFNNEILWKTTTKDNMVSLPDEVRSKMVVGQKYSWQVKAFSKEGTLIAVSSKVQFTINK